MYCAQSKVILKEEEKKEIAIQSYSRRPLPDKI